MGGSQALAAVRCNGGAVGLLPTVGTHGWARPSPPVPAERPRLPRPFATGPPPPFFYHSTRLGLPTPTTARGWASPRRTHWGFTPTLVPETHAWPLPLRCLPYVDGTTATCSSQRRQKAHTDDSQRRRCGPARPEAELGCGLPLCVSLLCLALSTFLVLSSGAGLPVTTVFLADGQGGARGARGTRAGGQLAHLPHVPQQLGVLS